MTTLRQAAQAVLDRWDGPHSPTAEGLADLRTALEVPENQVLQAQCDAFLANVQLLEVEIEVMTKERDALSVAGKLAVEALTEYANPYNWDEDFHGIRRKWREPSSSTPTSYNGFELAQKTLAVLQAAGATA